MMKDLDGILRELGQFGRYQIFIYILILFPLLLYSSSTLTYVFTTMNNDYRCFIPECEPENSQSFDQPWLQYAMPFENGELVDSCLRYKPALNSSNGTCSKDTFSSETVECDKFIIGTNKKTITKEFGLFCERNKWKRTLVGTINSAGMFLGMPIVGVLSDRLGRKTIIVWGLSLAAIFGILRSFAPTYVIYITLEFLDAISHSGVFNALYITAVEIVGPEKRGLGGPIITTYYSIGEILLGTIVLLTDDWRQYFRAIYTPMLIIALLYIWILPESIRWLIAHKKKDQVAETINRIARWNKTPITDEIRKTIENFWLYETNEEDKKRQDHRENTLKEILKSKKLILMIVNCCFCWITITFVYFGLSVYAVNISGNKYLNFILISFVEIPGYMLSSFILNKYGRKISLCVGLAVSGAACSGFHFIHQGYSNIRLALYFVGKLAITSANGTMYVLASEIFPTYLRNSLLGFCSTVGRIGAMTAPQVTVLATYVDPVLVFSVLAFTTVLLGLYFPETRNHSMPDSIKDAIDLQLDKKTVCEYKRNDEAAKCEQERILAQL